MDRSRLGLYFRSCRGCGWRKKGRNIAGFTFPLLDATPEAETLERVVADRNAMGMSKMLDDSVIWPAEPSGPRDLSAMGLEAADSPIDMLGHRSGGRRSAS